MVKKALILSFVNLFYVQLSQAEVSAGNCQEFSQVILTKFSAFEKSIKTNNDRLTYDQTIEVNELLRLACSPQFIECGFSVCKSQQEVAPTSTEVTDSNNSESSLSPTPSAETEASQPLPWVVDNMSCEAFLGQLRSRFQIGNLDDSKKKELKIALDLACGPKFKSCNFEACQKSAPHD